MRLRMSETYLRCEGFNVTEKNQKKLLFYHIPKCAGLTVTHHLNYFFRSTRVPGWCHDYHKDIMKTEGYINDFNNKKKLFKNLKVKKEKYEAFNIFCENEKLLNKNNFLFGHFPFSTPINFNNYLSFTILRDPVSRSISNYNFWIEKGFIGKNESIQRLFDDGVLESNLITKYFRNNYSYNETNENDIAECLQNIKKINLVIEPKNIKNLFNYLIGYYDLPNIYIRTINKTKKIQNITNSEKNIFIENNKVDLLLMEEIKKSLSDFSNFKKRENIDANFIYTEMPIFNNTNFLIFKDKDLSFVTEILHQNDSIIN